MELLAKRSAASAGVLGVAVSLALAACAPTSGSAGSGDSSPANNSTPKSGSGSATPDPCAPDSLHLIRPGTLTIGTDSPAYEPWFTHNDPSNGKGFESAVAYAVAHRLGFADSDVSWVTVPFNSSYAPGAKKFDFDINQISITPKRAEVVDFSDGYYQAAQALIVLDSSPYADATSVADLKSAKLGAQVGTTSLTAATDVIAPTTPVAVYDDTNAAKQALLNGQIDAIVVDLPTAFYITAAEIPRSTIVGQFQPMHGQVEEFGMLFEKGNPLVSCVDQALGSLKRSGKLKAIEKRWLSSAVDVPELG
jgi:polar amino acid transport system substrate-binding protein